MITVTKKSDPVVRMFQNRQLADVCLHYAGGGYTTKQTAAAMVARDKLVSTGKATLSGWRITMTPEVSNA